MVGTARRKADSSVTTDSLHERIVLPLQGARRFAWPLPDLWSVPSLSDDELRDCWRFRRGFMDLKPKVDPQNDWSRFQRWVRSADYMWIPRARDGRILGTFTYKIEPRLHAGRECVLIWPEYGYILPGVRKVAGLGVAFLTALARALGKWPGRPQYIVGTGYLPSFLSLSQAQGAVYIKDDPTMTEWERSLWHTLAGETRGYDPATQLFALDTIPRNPRTAAPKKPQLLQHWHRYLGHNPRWTQGYACLVLSPVKPSSWVAAGRWFATTARRQPQDVK